ncbi:MAG: MaoC family dehydratase N-terminal domain-containing protein [Clostridia bacterium]|nr:MaoC family dehydratase N-terminal domain-containing protein [Clostridia bacterium]
MRLYIEDVHEGDESPELVVENVTRTQIVRYAGASGDFNPIHHDETFAQAAGQPTVFAMGMMQAGFVAHLVQDWFGLANVRRFGVRFAERVWPGDTLRCRGRIVRVDAATRTVEAELTMTNQHGRTVITANASAQLPSRGG